MTNAPFADIGDYRDLETINAYNALVVQEKRITHADMLRYMRLKSRDNSRTPMQWNSGPNAGFSSGKPGTPWIMLNPNYVEINAEEQTGRADSVFSFYRALIQLRAQMDIITFGNFELLLPDDPDLFVYTRCYRNEELLIICNFASQERTFALPERFNGAELLLSNEEETAVSHTNLQNVTLGPFGAKVFYSHI
jgi:oligo-1,6-glucosidase